MRRPIIHIGFHKTGTSYLQRHVFGSLHQYYDVWTVRGNGAAIEQLVLPTSDLFDPGAVRTKFDADHAGCPEDAVPIVSHEDLCGHPVKQRYYGFDVAERISQAFPDAKVVIGIREQLSMIRSHYSEYILQGGIWPLSTFCEADTDRTAGFAPLFEARHLEYDRLIAWYLDRFAREDVFVMCYEDLVTDQVKFERNLHAFCGVAVPDVGPKPREHVSHGAATLEFQRLINRLGPIRPTWNGDWGRVNIAHKAVIKATALSQKTLPERVQKRARTVLTAEIERLFFGRYRESNTRLSALLGRDLAALGYEADGFVDGSAVGGGEQKEVQYG